MANNFGKGVLNPSLNLMVLSIPETTISITLLDYDLNIENDDKIVVTPILDSDYPNVEKITKTLSVITISGRYNPNPFALNNSIFQTMPTQQNYTDDTIQAMQAMENIFNNPKQSFLINVNNIYLATKGITQMVRQKGSFSPIKGSNLFSYSAVFYDIPTNPNTTAFIKR
jgi:hypothetical protein